MLATSNAIYTSNQFTQHLYTKDGYYAPKHLQEGPSGTCNATRACIDEPYYVCKDEECYHKDVFPIYATEWAGYITVTLLMALCNVAGIGGGAIDQPIMQVFFKF